MGSIFPKKLIMKPTNVFILSSTIAVNIPSLHSKTGQSEMIKTTSQSGIPWAVKKTPEYCGKLLA
ncbi:MAG: hypothetical protein L6V88_03535 [Anaerotruncus sp.]|nr:MAG: hypothetical protein L6V88_03535 [Anaerotruncus sp.]